MKVVVMGAGVVGVTSAWYLAEAGHEVTVVDRQDGAALETSFANGGQVSPCHAEPWANPATPMRALRWMGREDAPLLFRWNRFDPALWTWGARFLLNCTARRAHANTDRTLRVAVYSRACLQALRQLTGLQYDQKTLGILHIYRDTNEFENARKASELMNSLGLERQEKTPDQAVEIEPALACVHGDLAGAIMTPGDESGDAHKFTRALAELCAKRGVTFLYGTRIDELELSGNRLASISTSRGRIHADAFVLAAASWSPLLARQVDLRLPIYPAKGYSATLAVTDEAKAPTVSITDDEHKMVYSRLGGRLRCAGTAELAGWNTDMNEGRARLVASLAEGLFPGAGDFSRAKLWCGLRPVTPDSVPILGGTKVPGLYLNTGHGTLGWTMSCGSAKLLADIVSGRPPEIDTEGLGLDRFLL
ncbi:MAG TPA: D-amino acid dehydrogenase [Candidatus Sulfotelmatobacter sp.]|nr:D-amino acid dehydrogenase [Candidatus Sulfotelmatobacter sp.]